ncbi:Bax inhibitor-1/YccA family protein [Enterovibrio sp. ZSDZ35]|uniref:Modulator of FtsH protease n=2 Tax=Enterovibrio TaxID=188143 RepID=A0A1T4UGF7_9GAMM|nr:MULTISPECIES: Bax inhibitor-1/YccA family protein [Enterovibrio]MDD1784414.1 Bax inhibitor-1/YccA family protein [Enterovibrio sp. ZSDZ35]PKF49515.1 BAX inhibitor (BI)-1/YccA family protein [Enterovibrio nigricans]SKA51686.1 modulator of FtsH protease [Enterovibrio nigricans DSM 22720]
MNDRFVSTSQTQESVLATNKVLRNTYALLSMTLITSAIAAFIALVVGITPMMSLGMTLGALAIVFFVLPKAVNSSSGIVWTFVFTSLMGASLGPTLAYHLNLAGGPSVIMQALGTTGLVFLGLSAYAISSKKDFSFMGGFLVAGVIALLVAMIANIFLAIPALSLAISTIAVLIFSAFILYDTSNIINGGETNYIRATVSLYLDIFNIFVHLLSILGIMNSDD